jgi:DNA replication licensing factor MCM2
LEDSEIEEAEEDNVLDEVESESEGSGEDLEDTLEQDYREIPELDRYEQEGIDEDEYSEISYDARREAEEQLELRDTANRIINSRRPEALMQDFTSDLDSTLLNRLRRTQPGLEARLDAMDIEDEDEKAIDMEDAKGNLKNWIKERKVVKWIERKFTEFLETFKDELGNLIYRPKIRQMCAENKQSLFVSYKHLSDAIPTIALWIADEPSEILPVLNDIAYKLVNQEFNAYKNIYTEIYVRILDLPICDQIRDLRQSHLNKLVKVRGVVTRRTAVYHTLFVGFYYCSKCGEKKGPIVINMQRQNDEIDLGKCGRCNALGPFLPVREDTIYRNYQKITLQESPDSVPPGRVPRHKEVVLLADLIDIAKPGELVEVTGIFKYMIGHGLDKKHGFPVFATEIEAVTVKMVKEADITALTEEDKCEIQTLAKKSSISRDIIDSIAPSIYGHKFIKTALALAMFGGVFKDINSKHRIRGDINVLMLGDPGVAKSQFLKYVHKTAYRCVYTTGKGASAVGLTAGVHRDKVTKEWVLEGGALVQADTGMCLIDEFDKMNDHDRTSIHEAMEQQSISISKAGIVASLQARCSVVAAANPIKGRYDSSLNFTENVDLSFPILSRFDILCVVKDEVQTDNDMRLANFVLSSHIKSHPDKSEIPHDVLEQIQNATPAPPIHQDLLKKYIMYARQFVKPQLSDVDQEKITRFYSELRQESSKNGGIQIAVRHIESLLRMSEAFARMHLRDHVRESDIDLAIEVLLQSFLDSQKKAVRDNLLRKFRKYLGKSEEPVELIYHLLKRLFRDKEKLERYNRSRISLELLEVTREVIVPIEQFENEAKENGIYDLSFFYRHNLFIDNFQIQNRGITRKLY